MRSVAVTVRRPGASRAQPPALEHDGQTGWSHRENGASPASTSGDTRRLTHASSSGYRSRAVSKDRQRWPAELRRASGSRPRRCGGASRTELSRATRSQPRRAGEIARLRPPTYVQVVWRGARAGPRRATATAHHAAQPGTQSSPTRELLLDLLNLQRRHETCKLKLGIYLGTAENATVWTLRS